MKNLFMLGALLVLSACATHSISSPLSIVKETTYLLKKPVRALLLIRLVNIIDLMVKPIPAAAPTRKHWLIKLNAIVLLL